MPLRPTEQPSQAVAPAQSPPPAPTQPWVKPTFAQIPLNEALAGVDIDMEGSFPTIS